MVYCFSFFSYSIGLWSVRSIFWVWLRNQNNKDSPQKFNVTRLNEYRTTVWMTVIMFYHVLIAMTYDDFMVIEIGVHLHGREQGARPPWNLIQFLFIRQCLPGKCLIAFGLFSEYG